MKKMGLSLWIGLLFVLILFGTAGLVQAKKKDKIATKLVNPRVTALTNEDAETYKQLTKKQQGLIEQGKIEVGFNAWMVKLALGEPYYNTEHHPIYKDYEEVWLYTKKRIEKDANENKIIDPTNNWPSVHRITYLKICLVGDFFLLYDRGVVDKIIKDTSEKIYGSCTVETTEEFLPIIDGKPKENPK
jgi:hypothetical protein